jgi:hypothetical protein
MILVCFFIFFRRSILLVNLNQWHSNHKFKKAEKITPMIDKHNREI